MTTPNATGTRPERDTNAMRVSVTDAARILDITPDSVRARIRRGAIDAERVGGRWYVFLPAEHDTERDPNTIKHDTNATTARQAPNSRSTDALIGQLRSENERLWSLLAERDRALEARSSELAAERERSDVIQQLALSRIPAITAGEASQRSPEAPGRTENAAQGETLPMATRRPWWRRWLGIP